MSVDWDIRWGLRVQLLGILAFIGLVVTNLAWGWPGWWTLVIPVVVTIVLLRLVGRLVIGQMKRERLQEDRAHAQLAIKPAWTFTDRDTYGQWWDGQRWRYGAEWAWDGQQWKSLPAHMQRRPGVKKGEPGDQPHETEAP